GKQINLRCPSLSDSYNAPASVCPASIDAAAGAALAIFGNEPTVIKPADAAAAEAAPMAAVFKNPRRVKSFNGEDEQSGHELDGWEGSMAILLWLRSPDKCP